MSINKAECKLFRKFVFANVFHSFVKPQGCTACVLCFGGRRHKKACVRSQENSAVRQKAESEFEFFSLNYRERTKKPFGVGRKGRNKKHCEGPKSIYSLHHSKSLSKT